MHDSNMTVHNDWAIYGMSKASIDHVRILLVYYLQDLK